MEFKQFDQEFYTGHTRVQRLKLKRTRKGRVLVVTACLLVLLGALAYAAFVYADDLWIYIAGRHFSSRIDTAGAATPGEQDRRWLNVLLIGVDQREHEPSRADTLMVAMLNLKDKTVRVISIPRDTRVKIEGFAHPTKINHAHAKGGVELTRQTVEQFLGIPIHNYIETNFLGFANIIDILGGVQLDVEKTMYYPPEGIDLRKGNQRLNGHDALAYVRYRSDGKGDLPRIERQHKFLRALADQVLQPGTVLKLPRLAGELHDNVQTDMSTGDFLVLIGEFKNIGPDNVRFYSIPGRPEYIGAGSYYVTDEKELNDFMDKILSGENPPAPL